MQRHELDPVSLVAGLAYTVLGLVFLVGRIDDLARLRWVWPIALLALGAGMLLSVRGRIQGQPPAPPPADQEPDVP